MSSVNQLRPSSSPMYVGPAAHFSQTCTSAMTVPPPSYMLPQHHQPSPQPTSAAPPPRAPHDDKDQKNNALLILKMLCETPLLQAYLLDLLKARSVLTLTSLIAVIACFHCCSVLGGAVMQRVRHLGLRSVGRRFKSCSRQLTP